MFVYLSSQPLTRDNNFHEEFFLKINGQFDSLIDRLICNTLLTLTIWYLLTIVKKTFSLLENDGLADEPTETNIHKDARK